MNTHPSKANRMFLIILAFSIAAAAFLRRTDIPAGWPVWLQLMTGEILMAVPFLLICLVRRGEPLRQIPVKPLKISTLLMLLLFTAVMWPLVTTVNLLSQLAAPNAAAGAIGNAFTYSLPVSILLIAVVPAVCEEIVFRGGIYQELRRERIWPAALLSGLFFGLMHLNFNQFCYAAVMGVLFALLNEVTGSILSSMFVHFCVNAGSTTAAWLMSRFSPGEALPAEPMTLLDNIREIVRRSEPGLSEAEVSAQVTMTVDVLLVMGCVLSALSILLIRVILKKLARMNGREAHAAVLFSAEKRHAADALRDPAPRSVWTVSAAAAILTAAVYIVLTMFGKL